MPERIAERLLTPIASRLAAQLAQPRGWFGRVIMTRLLNRRNRRLIEAALDQLRLLPETRLLDVGFGGGLALELAARRGVRQLAGVDPSQAAVERLRAPEPSWLTGAELRVVRGSVEALPFEREEFDAIVSTNTVYFWPELGPAFSELRRVLAPGGQLALGFATAAGLKSNDAITRHGFIVRESEELVAEAGRSGFSDVRLVELQGRLPGEHRILVASA